MSDQNANTGGLSDEAKAIIDQVIREMDFEHLKRIAHYSPEERLEAMFEMIEFIHEVSEAGRRDRERSQR